MLGGCYSELMQCFMRLRRPLEAGNLVRLHYALPRGRGEVRVEGPRLPHPTQVHEHRPPLGMM